MLKDFADDDPVLILLNCMQGFYARENSFIDSGKTKVTRDSLLHLIMGF